MMKIGIITIATGPRHQRLCKKMLASLYQHFCKETDKKICVFSDDSSFLQNNEQFIKIPQLPNPLTALLKHHHSIAAFEYLTDCDFIYHIDADIEIITPITFSQIAPTGTSKIVVVEHPWQTTGHNDWLLENNEKSKAYIHNVEVYIQSCFYGMERNTFFNSYHEMNSQLLVDLNNKIITKWFDESYLNKHVSDKEKTILPKEFAWPLQFGITPNVKIIHYNAYSNNEPS